MAVYTSGDWHVKQGKEQEFVNAWKEFAQWSATEFGRDATSSPSAKLLRDKDDPTFFRSLGEWSDEGTIKEWRASEGFATRTGRLRELVDDWKIRMFELDAEIRAETFVGIAK